MIVDSNRLCEVCHVGIYDHGSALYDHYSCGHAFEKPLGKFEEGKWIFYLSPYNPKCKNLKILDDFLSRKYDEVVNGESSK